MEIENDPVDINIVNELLSLYIVFFIPKNNR